MTSLYSSHFDIIVIDDNKLDTLIAQKMLRRVDSDFLFQSFDRAGRALEYISNRSDLANGKKTILFIDLQMPLMNGFEFLDALSALSREITDQYIPIILTSSIAESDKRKSEAHPMVSSFLNKPLDKETLINLLNHYIRQTAY